MLMTVLSYPKCGVLKQGVPEDPDEFAQEILDEMYTQTAVSIKRGTRGKTMFRCKKTQKH